MISKIIEPILTVIRYHKKKIALFLGFYLVFLYFLFPFNDLGDFVSKYISEKTAGQVLVNFDTVDLSLIPQTGLELGEVQVETPFTPRLTAKTLFLAPNIAALLTFKPGGSLYAEQFMGGDLDLSFRGSGKNPAGKLKYKVNLDITNLSLTDLLKMFAAPVNITGNLSGSVDSSIDFELAEQPSGTIMAKASQVIMPESTVTSMAGPIPVPKINLGELNLESKMEKGVIEVSKFTIGVPGSEIYGNVTGRMDLKMERMGQSFGPRVGAYDLVIRMQISESLKQR
jgi:type II secretion system protein N